MIPLKAVSKTNRSHIRGATRVFVVKPEGKRPPVKLTSRWEDNTKMDFK